MASPACWKCLARPGVAQLSSSLSLSTSRTIAAAFSTSTPRNAAQPGKKTAAQKQLAQRTHQSKTLKIKKKAIVKPTGKRPDPGERKAMRKRIVLSNTNALAVPGLVDLNAEMATVEGMVGRVMGLNDKTVDSLRAAEAFKAQQGWNMFRRPALLVRWESVEVAQRLVEAEEEKRLLRLVVDGGRATGKSLLLIHAMAVAFVRGWTVVNIPEAQDVVDASTDYAPIPNTTPTQYSQNTYTAAWLGQIAKSNKDFFDTTEVSLQHNLPLPIERGTTLARLCDLGARDPEIAWPIFEAIWAEITAKGQPPILFALDSLQFAMQNSEYRAADFAFIHSHDLAIIRHFTACLSGSKPMPNGGAVIAATSRSHAPVSKSVDLACNQGWERRESWEGETYTERDPYERKYDARVDQALAGVEVVKLEGVDKKEARGLMEYWALSGVYRAQVDEKTVTEKWALAGNGIVGELERGALRMRI